MFQLRRVAARVVASAAALVGLGLTVDASAGIDTRLVAAGLNAPLLATAPVADGRVFIGEKGGTIKVVQGGSTSTFLSLAVDTEGERGLLGMAFDPGYADPTSPGHRRFFVDYTDAVSKDTVVASYRTSAANPSLADAASRVEVLRIAQFSGAAYHKGGWIGFKPGDNDHLFITSGDGQTSGNAQLLSNLFGKLLRVNINGDDFPADAQRNYAVPAGNPFAGVASVRGEIFALGLRNPWRGGFDPLTGDLWLADVGDRSREEMNFIAGSSNGGQNFGWRLREGRIATPGVSDPAVAGLVEPVFDYGRSWGGAIVGGPVVRGGNSGLDGQLVFADYISGRIWSAPANAVPASIADATELTALLDAGQAGALSRVASFGSGAGGELFLVDYASGKVVQVVPEPALVWLWLLGLAAVSTRQRWMRTMRPALLSVSR